MGHLKIHQDDVESERRECLQDLFTIACNSDLMPPKLQKFDGDLLVDFIVFRKQNPQRISRFLENFVRLFLRIRCWLICAQLNSEMKGTAPFDLAFDPDTPSH